MWINYSYCDVSFIYDSNGLWNNYTGKNLKIIVLNNNGGNIFRFIGDKELMKNNLHFFTTPHQVQIKLLVEAYGVDYLNCNEAADLSGKIEQLLKKIEQETGKKIEIEFVSHTELKK